jgi:hypothetical protein
MHQWVDDHLWVDFWAASRIAAKRDFFGKALLDKPRGDTSDV